MQAKLFYANLRSMTDNQITRVMCEGAFISEHAYEVVFDGEVEASDTTGVCNFFFEEYNVGNYGGRRDLRSMSVGDIVQVGGKAFICAPVGWKEIDFKEPEPFSRFSRILNTEPS